MFLRKYLLNTLVLLTCGLPVAAPDAFAAPLYRMTLLPQDFDAAALNRAGLVVGTAQGGAAVWSPTATTYLGTLLPGSQGLAINGDGAVAGIVGDSGFVLANGALSTFGEPATWATSINDAGQVAGFTTSGGLGVRRAFIQSGGAYTELPTFGGEISVANAINASGQVAGYASVTVGDDWFDPQRYAALYRDGRQINLGSLGGVFSEANDINDAGFVAGWSGLDDGFGERPFLYSPLDERLHDLGTLGGAVARANALNNAGTVVGLSDIGGADGFDYHAFIYGAGGMADLNHLVGGLGDWRLTTATDINDAGQILAQACRALEECRAVRLDLVTPVPEPGGVALMGGGLALLLWHARRRRRPGSALQATAAPSALVAITVLGAAAGMLAAPEVLAAPPAQVLALSPAQAERVEPAATQVPVIAPEQPLGKRPRFRVTFLPPELVVYAINNRGHVAGYNGAAAVWDGSVVRDYGALAPESSALAINDRGDLAGGYLSTAHVFSPAGLRNAGRQILQSSSVATALNDSGAVAGSTYFGVGERSRGFVLASGVLRMIPSFGGDWSGVAAINRAGQVTGSAALEGDAIPEPYHHAYIYRDKTMRDLGTLGGRNSSGNDINDAGQVVGSAETGELDENETPVLRPFLYSGGVMRDLSLLGPFITSYGIANGINNAGAVVGDILVDTLEGPSIRAFLFEGGVLRDLNELAAMPEGWTLAGARDINDARQVLALACSLENCLNVRLDPPAPAAP